TVDEAGVKHKGGQQYQEQPPALGEPSVLKTNQETRDYRCRRGEEVVRENEPHSRRERRTANHHLSSTGKPQGSSRATVIQIIELASSRRRDHEKGASARSTAARAAPANLHKRWPMLISLSNAGQCAQIVAALKTFSMAV